ncbi:MAG: TonB-dependent receptor [Gammaproteobacteria bacterium]|nr:TonB-dependent receptor [Gammaproteobacteria bacterium]
MKLLYKTILLFVLTSMTSAVAEQMPSEVMVVTAKRLPTDTDRFSGSVSVITAEQIERRQYQTLGDALRDVAGLSAPSSGGIGAQTSVFIRGAESDHVLILIDGVEVSDPAAGNRYEFSQLSLNGVERIEVLRGNYSAEYGSEALGGIINIITRTPTENKVSAQIEAGTFDRYSTTMDIDAVYKSLDFSLSGRYFETDGESFTPARIRQLDSCTVRKDRDGYRNSNAKINAGLLLVPKTNTKLTVKSEYSQADLEYDGGSCENLDTEQSSYTKRTTVSLSGDYFDGKWSPTWRMDYYQRDSRDTNSPKNKGERFKLNWHNVWRPYQDLSTAFGMETELEQARSDDEDSAFNADARSNAFYTELHYTPTPNWHLNFGWRNDDPDDFSSERSYQLGTVLHANLNTRFHINYATAFRAPSLLDRFRDFPPSFSANPNLKPETSRGWEVGIEQNQSLIKI